MNDESQYWELPGFEGLFLEDSYVLEISAESDKPRFRMEFVLREAHPDYLAPPANEQYCYRLGWLEFVDVADIRWLDKHDSRSTDATGEVDFGNIDALSQKGGVFRMSGDWGRVHVEAAGVEVLLDGESGRGSNSR